MALLRATRIERPVNDYAEGSALITAGRTRVLVTASVMPKVPAFLAGTGSGWITAEYGMLPRSTRQRRTRDAFRGRPDGRALEIQRLVGRALRQTVELGYIKGRAVVLDCDVLQADGGTRVAAVNAGMVALLEALIWMKRKEIIAGVPLKTLVGASSVACLSGGPAHPRGVDDPAGVLVLDPDYEADSSADVDLNAVFTESGALVELQATAERSPFEKETLDRMVELAREGASQAVGVIRKALGEELLAEAGLGTA